MESYHFLFPYERVPQGSRIVIYGAGKMGQAYLEQMKLTGYCKVMALADRNYAQYQNLVVPVISPEKIHDCSPDVVVIALRVQNHLKEFLSVLDAQGISQEKIICGEERQEISIFMPVVERDDFTHQSHACDEARESLLIYCMGGFGDFIVQKKTVETLMELSPGLAIDILCSHGKDFLQFLYADAPQVHGIELNLGMRYEAMRDRYAAAITFSGHVSAIVDHLREDCPFPSHLAQVFQSLQAQAKDMVHSMQMPLYAAFYRSIYRGENCYGRMTFGGTIPCRDQKVHIPQDAAAERMLSEKRLGAYVTVNYGNGSAHEERSVAKSWRRDRFETVIAAIHRGFPELGVVQIGPGDAVPLAGAGHDFLGVPWPMVAELLRHSLLHIDIEGGLVHLASQIGTKCLVLFGPTQIEDVGYPNNINLRAGTCHNCYGLYPDINTCARGLANPECMMSITPEMVMDKVRKYLGTKKGASV